MKPANRKEVIDWFQESQMTTVCPEWKAGLVPAWFHGKNIHKNTTNLWPAIISNVILKKVKFHNAIHISFNFN